MTVTKACMLHNVGGGANNVMTERDRERGPGYFTAQNAKIIALYCQVGWSESGGLQDDQN